jgi:hypothetical protein
MAQKCSRFGCELSSWRDVVDGPCILDMPTPPSWNEQQLRSQLLESLNGKTVNVDEGEVPPDCLVIRSRTLQANFAKLTKGLITREIHFQGCEFETTEFFQHHHFSAAVKFLGCRWPNTTDPVTGDTIREVHDCIFEKDVEFEPNFHPIRFNSCVFKGNVMFRDLRAKEPCQPTIRFNQCQFDSPRLAAIGGRCGYEITSSSMRSSVFIDANDKRVRLDGIVFGEGATIGTTERTDLVLTAAFVYKDVLITGGYLGRTTPKMVFDGIHVYGNSKVIFQNLNLSEFNNSGYRFWGSEFRGVEFFRVEGRCGLTTERTARITVANPQRFGVTSVMAELEALQESYKNIKLAFDAAADYRSANDFSAGELWAQWQRNIISSSGIRRQVNKSLSWYALYSWISDFGQSWSRPLKRLACVSVIAFVLYAALGVYPEHSPGILLTGEDSWPKLAANALDFTMRMATPWFKPDGRVQLAPEYRWVWGIALMQSSFTFIAGTFFLLALRRRFKR